MADAIPIHSNSDLARARYLREVTAAALVHAVHDAFPGHVDAATLADLGELVLLRANVAGDELEAIVRVDGLPALVDLCGAHVEVEAAGSSRAAAQAVVATLRERLHRPQPPATEVGLSFWWLSSRGPSVRHAVIEAPPWAALKRNYAAAPRAALDRLMAIEPPLNGRMLIWRGPPGTGKTHAIRALAAAWREWCSVHVVLDPRSLFGGDPGYLLRILTDGDAAEWRLLVLEDAGELAAPDAGGGTALAPLLNLTDGLLGQGARMLVLITTNEAVGRLHPAVRRAGRCLADVEFGPLSQTEARAWLLSAGSDVEPSGPLTLASLFALTGAGEALESVAPPAPFGFARALAR